MLKKYLGEVLPLTSCFPLIPAMSILPLLGLPSLEVVVIVVRAGHRIIVPVVPAFSVLLAHLEIVKQVVTLESIDPILLDHLPSLLIHDTHGR